MTTSPRHRPIWAALLLTTTITIAITACGSNNSPAPSTGPAADGRRIALDAGCAGCHGASFTGAAGPAWVGLYGSTVTLTNGTTVTADRAYLTEAIRDPNATRVAGFNITMPTNNLTDEQIDLIIDYIQTLAPPATP